MGDRVTHIGVGGGGGWGLGLGYGRGGRQDAIEHWTLPSDIIQARGRQRGAEGVEPTMMEAFN
jgi:hypothetical protein